MSYAYLDFLEQCDIFYMNTLAHSRPKYLLLGDAETTYDVCFVWMKIEKQVRVIRALVETSDGLGLKGRLSRLKTSSLRSATQLKFQESTKW